MLFLHQFPAGDEKELHVFSAQPPRFMDVNLYLVQTGQIVLRRAAFIHQYCKQTLLRLWSKYCSAYGVNNVATHLSSSHNHNICLSQSVLSRLHIGPLQEV